MATEKEHRASTSRSIRQLRGMTNPELDEVYKDADELTQVRIGIELGRRRDRMPVNSKRVAQ